MRGSVRKYEGKKGITWSAHYYLGFDEQGKKRYTTKRGFATRREAESYLADITKSMHQGTYVDPTKETLSDYLTKWIDYKRDSVRQHTIEIYESAIRLHIAPRLGRTRISELRPVDLRDLYRHLLRDKGLSKRTVSQIHTILHDALDRAVKWELLPRNVTDAVDAPKPERQRFDVWSLEDVRKFLFSPDVTGNPFFVAFLLALTTGMRQGEILGLRWQDLDLDKSVVHVVRTLTRERGEHVFGPPKSDSGVRDIPLSSQTVEALKTHRVAQARDRLAMGRSYNNQDLVIARTTGEVMSQPILREKFIDLVAKVGIGQIRFHDLRHTHASLLLELGENMKVIQEQLGHSTLSVTADTYTHLSKTLKDRPAQLLSTAIYGAKK